MSALRDAIVLQLQADSNIASAIATARADAGRDTTSPSVYPGLPSKGTAYPFITVTTQSAPKPERAFRGGSTAASEIVFEDAVYLVKAIDQNTSAKTVGEINAAIRVSLDGTAITVSGYDLINCIFNGEVQYDEQDNGVVYQHEGGIYQIWATKT